jgi:hypothetical protein
MGEKNADGKGSGQYDFTSLMGADKKKLLKELPSKFNGIIWPETCNTVEEIWRKFYIIYAMITCKKPTAEMMTDYHGKTKEWINLLISLRQNEWLQESQHNTLYAYNGVPYSQNF